MAVHTAERKQVMRVLARLRPLAKGFAANAGALGNFNLQGQPLVPAKVQAQLQALVAAADLVDANRATLQQSLAARDKALLANQWLINHLPLALTQLLGPAHPLLPSFGVTPKKPRRKRTAEEEAISVALRRQTRATRNTMGPKQRAAITTEGKPGLLVVDASGKLVPGSGTPPVAPGKKPTK